MIPGMSFSSSYPNRLKHRTRYSRGWTVSRGLAVAGCPRGLHPLHGLLSSWSPPSSLVPPSSTISTSLTWFVCTTLPPPPLCTPPVRPNPYTRSCSFFPLFFFHFPLLQTIPPVEIASGGKDQESWVANGWTLHAREAGHEEVKNRLSTLLIFFLFNTSNVLFSEAT